MLCLAMADLSGCCRHVALVLLYPGLNGTAGLPDVDLTTLAGHAVHTRSLESQVILHRPKETGDRLQG
jgi:hypothetical protein